MAASLLQEQCQLKILQNVKDYRPEFLGLLPLNTRRHLLPALPLIDLVALENTPFMQGINCDQEVWRECYEGILRVMNNLRLVLPYPKESKSSYRESCQEILLFLILNRAWPYSRFPIQQLLFSLRSDTLTATTPYYERARNVNVVELLRKTIALFGTLPKRLHIECNFFKYTIFWREDWSPILQPLLANVRHFSYSVVFSENQLVASYLLSLIEQCGQLQCISICW